MHDIGLYKIPILFYSILFYSVKAEWSRHTSVIVSTDMRPINECRRPTLLFAVSLCEFIVSNLNVDFDVSY